MKRKAVKILLVFVSLIVWLGSNAGFGYPPADSLQFPLDNYLQKKGDNYFGRKDLVRAGKWHLGDDYGGRVCQDTKSE